MTSDRLPTDVVLLRVQCAQSDLDAIAQQALSAPISTDLGATLQRRAWSAATDIAYVYLQLPYRIALSLNTLAPLAALPDLPNMTQLKLARLALMRDIPGASHGKAADFHYAVEMTPEAGWEIELQRWYDSEHLPGLARVAGCVHAQRFWNHDEGPQSLACYDLVDPETMGSQAWLAVRATDWSSQMRPRFTQTTRTMFTRQP